MARKSDSFIRGKSKFKQQPRVLVVCEDTKSSNTYLNDLRRRLGSPVDVEHFGDTSPTKIVNEAARRGKGFDFVYCVLDADTYAAEDFHPIHVIPKHQRNRMQVISSGPCFEYWLLLHFKNTRKSFTSRTVCTALEKEAEMRGYQKGNISRFLDVLFARLEAAIVNAGSVRLHNIRDGSSSPMSDVDLLVNRFKQLAMPQRIDS